MSKVKKGGIKISKISRAEHNLKKAQENYDRISGKSKELHLHFERKQNVKGKYFTDFELKREEKTSFFSQKGLLHKTDRLKNRVTGDAPGLTKFIDSRQPETLNGKVLKKTAQGVNFAVKDVSRTVRDTALASESAVMKTGDFAQREARNKLKQKYHSEAVDDYHRGAFLVAGTAVDAVKGTRNYFRQKKRNSLEKAKFKLKKAEYKAFKAKTYEPALKQSQQAVRQARQEYSIKKKLKDNKNKYWKKDLKQSVIEAQFKMQKAETEKKQKLRELKNQRSLMLKSSPGLLFLKPVSYSAKKRVAEPVSDHFSKQNRLQKEEDRRNKLQEKKQKTQNRHDEHYDTKGNATLIKSEQIIFDSDKMQFISVTTKDGHVFYVLINYTASQGEDNVFFLNKVDDLDLYALVYESDDDSSKMTPEEAKQAAAKASGKTVSEDNSGTDKAKTDSSAENPAKKKAVSGAVIYFISRNNKKKDKLFDHTKDNFDEEDEDFFSDDDYDSDDERFALTDEDLENA